MPVFLRRLAAVKGLIPRTLTVQLTVALLILLIGAVGSVGFTLYELNLRKHDYVILNLSGQLRTLAQSMVAESLNFQSQRGSPQDREAAQLFLANIRREASTFNKIVTSLQNRVLEPELTGRHAPLRCSWDRQSIAQLDLTARTWRDFQRGLQGVFSQSPTPTQLQQAATHIVQNRKWITVVATNLTTAFQHMMEGKLKLIAQFNQMALALFFLATAILLTQLFLTFVRPLRATLNGIGRVSQGEFGYQIPVPANNEIGQITEAFNRLSRNLDALFRLTDRVNRSSRLDDSLRFVFEEFRSLLPLDWVGMLVPTESGERFVLERRYTDGHTALQEGDTVRAPESLLAWATKENRPLHVTDLAATAADNPQAEFAAKLSADGRRSALIFPLAGQGQWSAVLVFAVSRPQAYNGDHLELLRNIGGQVAHGFQKTVVAENLVISAITGLAKLAENRDPETGDHLVRMARYAALIAEEMDREGAHAGTLPPDQVRDIFRFAPMHDIGKVGVEDRILLKAGRLDENERAEMERHPVIGGEVLRRCEAQMNAVGHSIFRIGIEIAECHHERFDGKGYPAGLRGEAIPLAARIVAAADVFDALTSKRPYKDAWPVERAVAVMVEEAGRQFDPEVIAAMQRALPKMLEVYDRLKHV